MSTSVLLLAYKLESEGTYKSFFNDLILSEPPEWHLSILVFNFEYSYSNRGITIQKINDKPTEIIYMDYTEVSKKQLDHYVNIILPGSGWTKDNYDLSVRNCQHFVHVLLEFLEIDEPIPNYYVNSRFVTSYKNIAEKCFTSKKDISSSLPNLPVNDPVRKISSFKLSETSVHKQVDHVTGSPQISTFNQESEVGGISENSNQFLPVIQHSPSVWPPQQEDFRNLSVVHMSQLQYTTRSCSHSVWQPQKLEYQRPWSPHVHECESQCPVHGEMIRSGFRINIAPCPVTSLWPVFPHTRGQRVWRAFSTTSEADLGVREWRFGNNFQNNNWGG